MRGHNTSNQYYIVDKEGYYYTNKELRDRVEEWREGSKGTHGNYYLKVDS